MLVLNSIMADFVTKPKLGNSRFLPVSLSSFSNRNLQICFFSTCVLYLIFVNRPLPISNLLAAPAARAFASH